MSVASTQKTSPIATKRPPYNDLVRSLFTRAVDDASADAEPCPPRCPSRMGFCGEHRPQQRQTQEQQQTQQYPPPAHASPDSPMPTPSLTPIKHGPDLFDPTPTISPSDDWADDIVLVDSMPISYISTRASSSTSAEDDGDSDDEDYSDLIRQHTATAAAVSGTPATMAAEDLDFGPAAPQPYAPGGALAHLSHHGLSRSALQHQKWLWGARRDEWAQWETDVADAAIYGGIADGIEPPPGLRSRSPSPAPTSTSTSNPTPAPTTPANTPTTMPPPPKPLNPRIFPRTGDLAALRDPQSARVDRFFGNYPLCTLQKAMFALTMRAHTHTHGPSGSSGSGGAASVSSARSSVSSARSSSVSSAGSCASPAAARAVLDDAASAASQSTATDEDARAQPEWERAWDARWEVLQELVTLTEAAAVPADDETRAPLVTTSFGLPVVLRALDGGVETGPAADEYGGGGGASGGYAPRPRFYLGDEEDDEDEDEDGERGRPARTPFSDDDDEDEDDYGEIVLNPRFGGPFVAECDVSHDFDDEDDVARSVQSSGPRRGRISF